MSLLSFCCLCRLHNSEHGDIRSILSNGQVFSGLLINGTFSKRYMHLYFLSCSYNFAFATLYFDGFLKVSNACVVVTIAPLLCHIHFFFSLLVIYLQSLIVIVGLDLSKEPETNHSACSCDSHHCITDYNYKDVLLFRI